MVHRNRRDTHRRLKRGILRRGRWERDRVELASVDRSVLLITMRGRVLLWLLRVEGGGRDGPEWLLRMKLVRRLRARRRNRARRRRGSRILLLAVERLLRSVRVPGPKATVRQRLLVRLRRVGRLSLHRLLRELLLLLLLKALLVRPHLLKVALDRARSAVLPHERLALAEKGQFASPARAKHQHTVPSHETSEKEGSVDALDLPHLPLNLRNLFRPSTRADHRIPLRIKLL